MNDTTFDALIPGAERSRIDADAVHAVTRSLCLRGVGKSFGGVAAIRDIDLDVAQGKIRAIIGPNGASKSTLLNVISGLYRADRGTIGVAGAKGRPLRAKNLARLGIGRTFQSLALFEGLDVELARRNASRIVMLRNGVSTEVAKRDTTAIDQLYFDAAP